METALTLLHAGLGIVLIVAHGLFFFRGLAIEAHRFAPSGLDRLARSLSQAFLPAAALSGLCASVKQPNVIFVPESAPQAKIAQLLVFGSTVALVKGTYDDAFELCLEAAKEYGWYNRNTGYNPYMSEGKKTASFEICEQLFLQHGNKKPKNLYSTAVFTAISN